jgi:hypothetical protein
LREAPMTSTVSIPFQKAKMLREFYQCLVVSASEVDVCEEFPKTIPHEPQKTENAVSSTPAS